MKNPELDARHGIWMTPAPKGGEAEGETAQSRRVADHLLTRDKVHEDSLHVFRLLAQPGGRAPLVLDIGANQGQSLVSLKNVLPAAEVVCFEPLPWCVESLRHMKAQPQRFPATFKFAIEPFALGETAGALDLYVPGSPDYMLTSQASSDLARTRSARTLAYLQTFFTAPLDAAVAHHVRLDVRTLDSFGLRPAGVKIDVEEHEIAVLRGAPRTLAASRPLLVVETGARTKEVEAFLEGFGYARYLYAGEEGRLYRFGEKALTGNSVFLTEDHVRAALEAGLL